MEQQKQNEFNTFVGNCFKRINIPQYINKNVETTTYLSSDNYHIATNLLSIINKYKIKFLDVRNSDIEAMLASGIADKTKSNSYEKHMRPSMIKEFENAYQKLTQLLNIDIFALCHFPIFNKNGNILYKKENEENDKKNNKEYEIKEIVIKKGPSYAPCYIYVKENQIHNLKCSKKETNGKDAWC